MKKTLVLVALLAFVGAASAEDNITLFWSTTGQSADFYNTTLKDFRPGYQPPTAVPVGPSGFQELPAGTYDLFLWGQFRPDEAGWQVYGLDLKWLGTATHGSSAAYRQKWGTQGYAKRWDGSTGLLLDGDMVAVTANGVYFSANDVTFNLEEPLPSGKFLIGAAQITGVAGDHAIMDLNPPPPGKDGGIRMRDDHGVAVPWATLAPADVLFIPEPASMLLFGLAGLFLRRR